VKLLPLLQHGLDENVQLVGALVLDPVDPPVVPLAVLQAGEDHLLWLVNVGYCRSRFEWASAILHLGLQTEAGLADAVAGLLLGVGLVLLGGLLPTTTLWVSFLAIPVAIFSEMALDSTAARIVFSWAILPITVSLVAAAIWGHDNLVQAFLYEKMPVTTCWLVSRIPWDLLAVSRATACLTALAKVMFCSARRSCCSSMLLTPLMNSPRITGLL
jgi:hypothetical protein